MAITSSGAGVAAIAARLAIVVAALSLLLIATARAAESATLPKAAAPPPVYTENPEAHRAGGPASAFLARIREEGRLPVIVGLRMSLRPEDKLSPAEARAQGAMLRGAQDRVVARVFGAPPAAIAAKRYSFIPFMAFTIDEAEFGRLLADPEVASIQEDITRPLQQSETAGDMAGTPQFGDSAETFDVEPPDTASLSLIHDDYVLSKYGVSGVGQVVAILDTGVAKSHPMLAGKAVSEACYSTTNAAMNQVSLCPGGAAQSTAKGSGVNCPVNISGCDHGTHVASIAAGADVGAVRGVASGSKIIAIQVFSKVTSAAQCGSPAKTPCIKGVTSDLISGLQRVYALRNKYKIAAVNMSVGGGVYSTDCDSSFPAEAAAFAQLYGADIATVVASGNDGSNAGVGFPGCISTAITVGSSSKGDTQKQLEYVSAFSNLSNLVELMAPGENILAAVPKGAPCDGNSDLYCSKSGTSMAAPHVAGAIAVLRGTKAAATVDGAVHALECSGKIVERTRENPDNPHRLPKPRIDMLGAYNTLNKVPKRSWTFKSTAQAFDWTPFQQDWLVSSAGYHALPPYPPAYYLNAAISSTANCDVSLDVTVNMTRKYPKGQGDGGTSGVILKSQLNFATGDQSGYYFGYAYSSTEPKAQRGLAFIYQIDHLNFTLLCSKTKNVPVNFNQANTVRAVTDGSTHKLYLNGKLMCSSPDYAGYDPGPVSVASYVANTTAGTFNINSMTITSKALSGSQQSDVAAEEDSEGQVEGPPPARPSFLLSGW